jgi:hypothetical protein
MPRGHRVEIIITTARVRDLSIRRPEDGKVVVETSARHAVLTFDMKGVAAVNGNRDDLVLSRSDNLRGCSDSWVESPPFHPDRLRRFPCRPR